MRTRAFILCFFSLLVSPASIIAAPLDESDAALKISKALARQCEQKLQRPKTNVDEVNVCKSLLKLMKASEIKNSQETPRLTAPATFAKVESSEQTSSSPSQGEQKRLFVRADRIDNLFYGVIADYSSGQAKGVSLGYTDNRAAQTQTGAISPTQNVMISGTISYLLPPTPVYLDNEGYSKFASAFWVYGNGTWDHPLKQFGDASALKSGIDFQFSKKFPTGVLDDLLFNIAPYFQTDFNGDARAAGSSFTFEPVISSIYLGQSRGGNSFVNGFWVLRPEVDFLKVTDPGLTLLSRGTYDWLGVTARTYLFLFPSYTPGSSWAPPWLANRFSVFGTGQYYWDSNSRTEVRYYSTELQYNLSGCTTDMTGSECPQGSSSLSFEYDWGIDRDTLVKAKKYLIKLTYKN
jgi:hypothetical protein